MVDSLDLEFFERAHLRIMHRNLPTPMLYEKIANNREGLIAHLGPIVVRTGHYAPLGPEDKYIVEEDHSKANITWSLEKNPLSENHFNILFHRLLAYMHSQETYAQDCLIGSLSDYQIPIRIITETAWHSLFARNMFYQIREPDGLASFEPAFTIIHVPGFTAIPEMDGTRSVAFVIVNLQKKLMLIGGSSYAAEIKQAVFTVANYLMPESVFCIRGSANIGKDGDVAVFMGREDTGKTTLAVDPDRQLIGDHAHGWSDNGIFSLEWGGYAKLMDIDPDKQPTIYACTRRFGTILENVAVNPDTRRLDLSDQRLTENTRAAYPVSHLPNALRDGLFPHPRHLFLLTCDAFGVFPPIARLTPEQAMYAFMTAYTSKFVQTAKDEFEPNIMFSIVFGDTMLAKPAHEYGKRFMENILKHGITCWLLNTGWCGEPSYKGQRIPIEVSRALVKAAISGELSKVAFEADPVFQYEVPCECPGGVVPANLLNPREAAEDAGEFEMRAMSLVTAFMENFQQYEGTVPDEMRAMMTRIISIDDKLDLEEFFSM